MPLAWSARPLDLERRPAPSASPPLSAPRALAGSSPGPPPAPAGPVVAPTGAWQCSQAPPIRRPGWSSAPAKSEGDHASPTRRHGFMQQDMTEPRPAPSSGRLPAPTNFPGQLLTTRHPPFDAAFTSSTTASRTAPEGRGQVADDHGACEFWAHRSPRSAPCSASGSARRSRLDRRRPETA